MKYYVIAAFDKGLRGEELQELDFLETIKEFDLPEWVYVGRVESSKSIDVVKKDLRARIVDVVKNNACFLSVSTDKQWTGFTC